MAGQLPGNLSQHGHGIIGNGASMMFQNTSEEPHFCSPKWYFSRQEIEECSPSREDEIDYKKESQLRKFYCSFIQELGMKLKVPQLTIATAMILCHRFYLRQSHAKNEWQIIASACMFLASKVEETPRLLKDVVAVAYETINRRDPAAAQRIKQKEVFEKQKELIVIGERLLLTTVAFDLNIQHPYKPLVAAIKRLKISHNELVKVAWNFVNDWLWTTLCLQYKPHYIAAGSLFLAAKFHKVKLSAERGKAWWLEFDVAPLHLEKVIQQMLGLLEQKKRPLVPSVSEKAADAAVVEKAVSCSSQSCVLSASIGGSVSSQGSDGDGGGGDMSTSMKDTDCSVAGKGELSHCRTSDSGSMNSIVEDGNTPEVGEVQATVPESDQISSCKMVSVNVGLSDFDKVRIREALKRRRCDRATRKVVVAIDDDDDSWIERELERV
ncbi:cyclin-T1-4-like isoform X2 [Telopea speciosissima]|uniref:cyclin-T1-4-like isoform X2 n=1 Tax=Telopea speciosissima TaxID=54955 RepID=UPI001CC4EEC2|nr:cyclin-T1-4-like isoform X2 [Telopea speciosissima]